MKSKQLLLLLLIALMAPWAAMAQETLTVYSNTTQTQSNAPMFVEYFKNYTITQTVFPASDLTAMSGKTITAITFYTTSTNIPYTTQASAVIYLKEVQNETISAYIDKSTATTVCTGYYEFVSDGNDGGMVTITFTTPFPYNGGNLLFGCENTNRVDCKKMSFKGISQNGASMGGQSTSYPVTGKNNRNFLPKTTFTYTFTPTNLQVGSVTTQSATLTWQVPEDTDIDSYSYSYKKHSDSEWSSDYTTSDTEATLNNLDPGTEYDFRVKALYSGNHETPYATTTFFTDCDVITVSEDTPWTENFESFYYTQIAGGLTNDAKAKKIDDGCWDAVIQNGSPAMYAGNYIHACGGTSATNQNTVQFYNNKTGLNPAMLILPEFDDISNLKFEFYGSYATASGTLQVGYCTYTNETWNFTSTTGDGFTITTGRNDDPHTYGPYYFVGAPSGSRIALKYTPVDLGGCINLDEFIVSIVPSCDDPTNLANTDVTATTASFSWTGSGDFEYVCVPQGNTPDWSNATSTSNTSVNLEGLSAGTNYDFYVRKVCVANLFFSDAVMESFATETVIVTYTITVTSNDPTLGTVTGGGTYNDHETATLTATPGEGYIFTQWNDGNTDNPRNITVTGDASYVAYFEDPCSAITIVEGTPWTENFDEFDMSSMASYVYNNSTVSKAYRMDANCYDVYPPYTTGAAGNNRLALYYPYKQPATSGDGSIQFWNANNSGGSILILPKFSNDLNDLTFEFKANVFQPNNEGAIEVGYWYGATFYALYTGIKTFQGRSGNDNVNASGDYFGPYVFSGNIPEGSRIALRYSATSSSGCINVDDLRVGITPSCVMPRNLEVFDDVTSTSVTLGWIENGDADAWQICLNGDETNLIFADSNPFTVTGLTPETAYTAKVRAYCSDEDQSDWCNNIVSFETPCAAIVLSAEQPYSENFDSYSGSTGNSAPTGYPNDQLPDCWQFLNRSTSSSSYPMVFISSYSGYPVSGNCLFFRSSKSTPLYAILPLFEEDIADLQLTFTYRNESTNNSNGTLIVGYMTNPKDANTFTAVLTCSKITTRTEKEVRFNNAPAGSYIAFKYQNGTGDNYYLAIDNVEVVPISTFTKTIVGVGEENWDGENGGYYLIASPLAEDVTPNADNGFIVGDYDLYMFDQAEENEWVNYKDNENGGGFSIVNGTGYLYASKEGTTLTFTGVPYSSDGTVTLSKTTGAEFAGHNLVGNPFGEDAYITKSFYTLENSDTYSPNTAEVAIHAMQGLLVVANEDGETLTFSTEAPAKAAKLNMNVTKGRALVDQAIISFNEGQQLPKLQFRNGSTKVYIPQEGKDYAIVSAESSMGEMPVNFKAENNGTYTLSFTTEEVSFAYLHLIDNMTGIETDLLATLAGEDPQSPAPSYTFYAKTTDYESRFKLVFATGNNANDDNFAFFSNGSFVINNEGEATLQVIDVNGRILKSESINGCANVNVKAAAGVYMLRLVNGNDVKVQKVVVR